MSVNKKRQYKYFGAEYSSNRDRRKGKNYKYDVI